MEFNLFQSRSSTASPGGTYLQTDRFAFEFGSSKLGPLPHLHSSFGWQRSKPAGRSWCNIFSSVGHHRRLMIAYVFGWTF